VLKAKLDRALCSLIWFEVSLTTARGLGLDDFKISPNPCHSMILLKKKTTKKKKPTNQTTKLGFH